MTANKLHMFLSSRFLDNKSGDETNPHLVRYCSDEIESPGEEVATAPDRKFAPPGSHCTASAAVTRRRPSACSWRQRPGAWGIFNVLTGTSELPSLLEKQALDLSCVLSCR